MGGESKSDVFKKYTGTDIARPLMCEPLRHECFSIVRHTSILALYLYTHVIHETYHLHI